MSSISELTAVIQQLREEVAQLSVRVAQLEKPTVARAPETPVAPAAEPETLPEEIVLVISAAIAAFLGKRAHIRQIRLIGSVPWAQQGRVTIQAARNLERFH